MLPKHWWEGTDKAGNKRDVAATTLEPPLGCGAYRIKEFVPGRTIVYERVKDYWGKDLNVNVGRDNFDELRFEYFRDATVALEAFKADAIDWRTENSAKNWATAYDFPGGQGRARRQGGIPDPSSRRHAGLRLQHPPARKFKDPRVRRAFNFALDFEEMNKQLFFGQYKRINSYFEGTELASSGLPEGEELEILETVRDKVPPEVFTTPYTNPVNGSAEDVRANLREATRLLREAGYEVRNQKLVNAKTGEPLTVEFLIDQPELERIVLFYKPSLERLGIKMSLRTVDDAQYENRLRSWDFDIIVANWGQSLSPGNEQRDYWGSQAADQPGSRNLVGIKNPAVDALIERVIFAKNRAELVAATKALDRVLLWNHYVVPQWTYGKVAQRALGPLRPSRSAAEIRLLGDSRRSGGGTRPRRRRRDRARDRAVAPRRFWASAPAPSLPVRSAAMRRRSRQPSAERSRAPRHVGVRRSEISGRLPAFRLRQSERAEGRRCSRRSARGTIYNQNFLHLQFAQQLHPAGRRGAGHGADLRDPDGARRATSRTRCTALPRARCASPPTA